MNPCTRCNGSGTEPDPLARACERLWGAINGDHSTISLREAASELRAAALAEREQREARITFLSAALRDILGRFPDPLLGQETHWRARNEDIGNWRKILDGES